MAMCWKHYKSQFGILLILPAFVVLTACGGGSGGGGNAPSPSPDLPSTYVAEITNIKITQMGSGDAIAVQGSFGEGATITLE